jgi:hypothetical protein
MRPKPVGRPRLGGELRNSVVAHRVGDNAVQQRPQRRLNRHRSGQALRELRLSPGPLHEQHQPSCDLSGELGAVIGLHQREGQVHARGRSGRGEHIAVLDVDPVRFHLYVGVPCGQLASGRPVGGYPAPAQQAGRGKDLRAAAH